MSVALHALKQRYKLKHQLRSCLDRLAVLTGLLRWYEHCMRRGLTILMYHRVVPLSQCIDYPLPALVVPVDAFRQQMQWLAANCRVLPMSEALAELTTGGPFAKPLVAVTFDDGYKDNYTLAAPLLEEYGLRGTFFVTSGFVTGNHPLWYDRAAMAWQLVSDDNRLHLLEVLRRAGGKEQVGNGADQEMPVWMAELKLAAPAERMKLVAKAESLVARPPDLSRFLPMEAEQVAALYRQGHEIASHSVSHPILPQLDDKALAEELKNSAQQISAWTGAQVKGFCYPNGDYDPRVEQAVIQAGYHYACTVEDGLNRPGVCLTRLARLSITRQRTMRGPHHDLLGFRAELSRWRALWRR